MNTVFKFSTTLNKGIIAALLLALFLLMVPQQGLAATPLTPIGEEEVIDDRNELYDDIVNPLYIPCDYWHDGIHRYQNGKVTYDYVKRQKPHNHVINGVNFPNYYIYDVYRVQDKYCACGDKTTARTYDRESHSVE